MSASGDEHDNNQQTDTCTSLMNSLKVTHTERSRSTYTYHIKHFQEFAHLALIVHDLFRVWLTHPHTEIQVCNNVEAHTGMVLYKY